MVIIFSPGAPVLAEGGKGRADKSRGAGGASVSRQPVNAGLWMCVSCSPRTPGHHGRGTDAHALAGGGRCELWAKEMHHANVNLKGRLPIRGGAVGPAETRANH